jgi:hypothetical protein
VLALRARFISSQIPTTTSRSRLGSQGLISCRVPGSTISETNPQERSRISALNPQLPSGSATGRRQGKTRPRSTSPAALGKQGALYAHRLGAPSLGPRRWVSVMATEDCLTPSPTTCALATLRAFTRHPCVPNVDGMPSSCRVPNSAVARPIRVPSEPSRGTISESERKAGADG